MAQYTYYLIFVIALVGLLIKKRLSILSFLLIVLFSIIVSALRFGFGADYFSYQIIYENIMTVGHHLTIVNEPLYTLYNYFFIFFGLDYFSFVGLNTLLLIGIIVIWIKFSSVDKFSSYFIYISIFFLVWNLSTFRQAMALSLGVLLLYNKRLNLHLFIQLLIVPILAMFHVSALFFWVLLIFGSIPWKRYYHLVFLAIGLIFTLFPTQSILASIINNPSTDIVINIGKIRYYFNGMAFTNGFLNINAFMRLFFFGLIWVHYEHLTRTKYLKRMTDIFLVGMSLYFFLSFNALFASRLTIYALFLLVILLPEILSYYEDKQKWKRVLAMIVFVSLCTFMYFKDLYAIKEQLGIDDGKWYVEYQSIFDHLMTE